MDSDLLDELAELRSMVSELVLQRQMARRFDNPHRCYEWNDQYYQQQYQFQPPSPPHTQPPSAEENLRVLTHLFITHVQSTESSLNNLERQIGQLADTITNIAFQRAKALASQPATHLIETVYAVTVMGEGGAEDKPYAEETEAEEEGKIEENKAPERQDIHGKNSIYFPSFYWTNIIIPPDKENYVSGPVDAVAEPPDIPVLGNGPTLLIPQDKMPASTVLQVEDTKKKQSTVKSKCGGSKKVWSISDFDGLRYKPFHRWFKYEIIRPDAPTGLMGYG